MNREPAIVGRYPNGTAAHLARLRLESEGIEAVLIDEHTVSNDPLIPDVFGGVKLMVAAADVAAAREVLARPMPAAEPLVCPQCGSTRVTKSQLGRRSALLTVLLLGFSFGRWQAKLRCADCKHTWRE